MNKTVLKKIANELNIKLKGETKAFIYVACKKYLESNEIFHRDLWLKNFLNFHEDINSEIFKTLEICDKQDFDTPEVISWLYQYFIRRPLHV